MEISVPEAREIFNEIQQQPEKLFEMIRFDIQQTVGDYLSSLIKAELTHFLGREPYERGAVSSNHRNGTYKRRFALKGIGNVEVQVPRDRKGEFATKVIPRSKQYDEEIAQDLSLMYLAGISTRSLSMISRRLVGRAISSTEISHANVELSAAVEHWRMRDLSREPIKYIFVDGVNFHMRINRDIELVPVLAAIGVTEAGHRLVLSLQSGDKESSSTWREFFKDLKVRGLDGQHVILGVMDGLPGLEKVFRQEFPGAKVQRCQVHVARNVLAKVPQKSKQQVADDIRSIFYASSRKKAMEFFDQFVARWEMTVPSAVSCLDKSIASCLAFFDLPEEEWISMRTTNIIERLNKEFKRRTKPMEIVAGEAACYRLLAFISLRMELHWRSNPIGKVRKNLPFLKESAWNNFTQKS
ncbi:MAG: IS256 family transposase [Desulfobulbaceae bacterium]|nr:IS256 family transposase [Desulfobulbaceae bacterium]